MSETTNLKLFKHDNPSTNTNPFDVEQSLNENWDKIDTEIGNIRENINGNDTDITDLKSKVTDLETNLDTAQNNIDEIKQEQITQNKVIEANTTAIEENTRSIEQNTTDITKLQEENSNLKAQIPTGKASGEEISLRDSAEMELVNFGLQGNSKQETTKGLQILEDTNAGTEGWNMLIQNGAFEMSKYTNLSDGIEACKFKCTESSSGYKVFHRDCNTEKLKNNTKYTLQLDVLSNKNFYLFVAIQTVAGQNKLINFVGKSYTTPGKWQTFKMVAESNDVAIVSSQILYLSVDTINTANDYFTIKNLILVEGDYSEQDLDWERYTGVEAMPNLNYPSKVQAVGDNGNIEIVTSNKNVLDLGQSSMNNIIFNKNKVTVNSPTASARAGNCNLLNNKFISGKTLVCTFIANGTIAEGSTMQFLFRTQKNNYKVQKIYQAKIYTNDISNIKINFDSDETISEVYLFISSPNINMTLDVQVKIADTASDFIEHKGNTYQIPVQREMLANDYIDYANKKEVHSWKKVIKTSADDFNVTKDTTTQTFQFNCTVENGNLSSSVLCNMFKFWDKTWKNTGCFISYNSNFYALIKFGEYGFNEDLTIEQAKQKFADILAETSLVFYYTLTVAEELDLTEEQKQVLEQIVKDGTCKEVTHFYTTEDLKPTIELKYYKDLETLFKNQSMQETLNNVQAQILELGGN